MRHSLNAPANFLLLLILLGTAAVGEAAEFSFNDLIPEVTSIVFTQDAIGLTLEPDFTGGQVGTTANTRYFVAKRMDLNFRQVSSNDLAELLANDHYQNFMNPFDRSGFKLIATESCRQEPKGPPTVRRELEVSGKVFSIETRCHSGIVDALRVGDEAWVATYRPGDHGSYGSEGILVFSAGSLSPVRIDAGPSAPTGIAQDPWSNNIWIVTFSRITVVARDRSVKTRYWPLHDFDMRNQRPDIFVVGSMEPKHTNPYAVIANALGEASYGKFVEAIASGTDVANRDVLYNFHIGGDIFSHHPQLPAELDSVLDAAEPTKAWRRFACMVPGERAQFMCEHEFVEWPEVGGRPSAHRRPSSTTP